MITNIVRKVFGSKNDRELKRMTKLVKKINDFEEPLSALTDDQLKAKTAEFRKRVADGETLDELLSEAFAVVREAGKRTLNMRHFDCQMIGGMVLHEGKIAEMRTGEGKTLVATLPAYLNSLSGGTVILVTVNDYLAQRDAKWMSPLYNFLGMTVGVVLSQQDPTAKRDAYQSDIVYGTNNEFGFDYLRDNMAFSQQDKMQRGLHFAIVDEVDSILIDEARTPLIISGPAEDSSDLYKKINKLIPLLQQQELIEEEDVEPEVPGHFTVDEKHRSADLTELGHVYIEELLVRDKLLDENDSLYAATNLNLLHHVQAALKAHVLFHKDVEYIVQNNKVVLIDEHTGRTMPGRRLSEGLHQAIEAKEGAAIQNESQTLASTTFQNYFRLYHKLSGMTGTADTEAFEFHQIYGLQVVVIPTNKPPMRNDLNDLVFLTKDEKFEAILDDVKECMEKRSPVLVGTASIETSEEMSLYLKKAKIEHKVLNAKYHQQEAEIIAQAGRPGAVTIATNMAGRGTDIVLGGNWEAEIAGLKDPTPEEIEKIKTEWQVRHKEVLEAGGLHILGTERHESRRIDNQLRGRAGRQGDPGLSRFYLSLEDNLMRIFASDRVKNFMQALGMERGEAIEHRMVTNAIEKAQKKVEGRNFDIRKQLLEYDDVANDQRQLIYQQRNDLMAAADVSEMIDAIRSDVVNDTITEYIAPQSLEEQWKVAGLESALENEFAIKLPVKQWLDEDAKLNEDSLRERILEEIKQVYKNKSAAVGDEMRVFEKQVMLQVLDALWKEHLATMDHLRQGIHLRAYAQKNPKQEYKREAFELFQVMLENMKREVVRFLSRVEIRAQSEIEEMERQRREAQERQQALASAQHSEVSALSEDIEDEDTESGHTPFVRDGKKVGRNESCPCGSGKKYKQCHGKLE